MNLNQLVLGAAIPFLLGGILFLLNRHRSWRFFIFWPGFMAAGAFWAVIPDLPRLVGAQALYLRLSHLPICDIFFFHYTIDQIEVDSPWLVRTGVFAWVVMVYGLIAAALVTLVQAENKSPPRPREGEVGVRGSDREKTQSVNASTTVHFALGWLIVSLAMAPGLWRAWITRRPLGRLLTQWVGFSAGSGIWALLPSLIHPLGWMPPDWSLNVFWGYGWLSHSVRHSQIVGPAFLSALLALQYALIVAAYFRVAATRE